MRKRPRAFRPRVGLWFGEPLMPKPNPPAPFPDREGGAGLSPPSLLGKGAGGLGSSIPAADIRLAVQEAIADLAEEFSADEIRVAHEQNLVLPYVALDDLPALFDRLASHGLATANTGLVTDIISCPGLDFCALATARSIPVAQRISERFGDGARAQEIGELKINI